jgi:hypothetical protein
MAAPCVYTAMLPGIAPSVIGTASSVTLCNSINNSIKFDPHQQVRFVYKIPRTSDISQIGGNELKGGWLPVNYAATAPTTTTSGVILFSSGSSGLPGPLTQVYGQVNIDYDVSFLIPE